MKIDKIENGNVHLSSKRSSLTVKKVLKELHSASVIHDDQNSSNQRQHWSERCWWLVTFVLSAWLCGSSIQHIWVKWHQNPVTMSFTERMMPISTIPFPKITICPEIKAHKPKLDITSIYHSLKNSSKNITDLELARMETLFHTCQDYFVHSVMADKSNFGRDFLNETVYNLIQDMAPPLNETIIECKWQDVHTLCSSLFSPIFTREGLCFTFNALDSREIYSDEMAPEMMTIESYRSNISHWNVDYGYDEGINDGNYPFRMYNAKKGAGLSVALALFERDLEYICRGPIQGFKLILSTPGDVIQMTRRFFRVPLAEMVEISIKPKLIITSDDLRTYSPDERKCFFSTERSLRFFKFYTENNCAAECLANFTIIECGCVKFSMPREKGSKICGAQSMKCYLTAENKLYGEDIIDGLKDRNAKAFRKKCNCLPACTSIYYDAEIDRAKYEWKRPLKSLNISLDFISGKQPSIVAIFFGNHEVITFSRSALYTTTEFLAICGGLIGLFLGLSALSFMQCIYKSIIRLCCMFQQLKYRKEVLPLSHDVLEKHIDNNIVAP